MEDGKLNRAASTVSKRQRLEELPSDERESGSPLLPSSDSPEKINKSSESRANSESSASYTNVIENNYVFLSFRGLDTRKGFVDHLYYKLLDVGLSFHPNFMFRDDENLCFGEPIAENLLSVIKLSKVSIPIISENYTASEWCLREIIQIMECVESGEQKVYPVLYKVTPGDVRDMQGKFGDAFRCRKHTFDKEVKRKGPEALKKAVTHKIIESEKFADGREGKLVKELVRIILQEQQRDFPPPLPMDLVGIDDHEARVMNLADTACSEAQIIVVYGIGGIGKTTLATIIYKNLFDKFQCRSFLKDIRETIKIKGMDHVQSLLISDITESGDRRVDDSGIAMIRRSCKNKEVLFLLDDVDCQDHLDNLIGGCEFSSKSRIIITCRDKALLNSEYKGYRLQEMNYKDALLLFSRHAFEMERPPLEFTALSTDIVATTGGLPLALQVIGSLLNRKEKSIWIETWEKLRKVPQMDVQQKLRISYDSLGYEEQQMFLDIACFFIGIDKRIATYLWEDLHYCPHSGLERMIKLSVMKIDDNNELRMHDLLRDLGKAIAYPADKKPWKCSRLWDKKATIVQQSKEENRNIEALRLDKNGSIKFMERESFKRMPYLQFLHLSEVEFVGDFGDSLSGLRWLEWEMCPNSFKATNIYLEKLLVLDLSRGFISENWEGWSSIKMEKLKVLNLSRCFNLRSTPNLSAFKNLEMLILECCARLEEIDPSIGDVKHLASLNFRRCEILQKLPEQLSKLENLEELVVDSTKIKEIPPCIGSLKKLKRFSATGCWRLTEVPGSIICPVSSSLVDVYKLQLIPSSIGWLRELVELDLSDTGIKELPESIGQLNKLKIMKIYHGQIQKLPSSIGKLQRLQELDASYCFDLEGQILVDKGGLSSLKTLTLTSTKICGLPENLDQLSSLEHLNLLKCRELQSLPKPPFSLSSLRLTCQSNELPSLSHLKHLKELTLFSCMSLQSIPELPSCIRKLWVRGCPKLERLPNLFDLKLLSELWLAECNGLKILNGLEALKSLRRLNLSRRTELFNLDDFDEEPDNLHVIRGLEKLGSLEVLDISGRKHIQVLDLSKSEHLKELIVQYCESLVEIRCPSKFLEHWDRHGCKSLRKLPDFLPHDRP